MGSARRFIAGAAALAVAWAAGAGAPAGAAAAYPNDEQWRRQWGPEQIGVPWAWEASAGDGVVIAVVDSGVDMQHPEFEGKLTQGYDFADNDPDPDDDSELEDGAGVKVKGHGTHVAGIAAAHANNGEGVAGVAPAARIMPLKVFPSRGSTLGFTAVPQAIRYAVDQGAQVINLSLGTFETGVSLVGFTQTACADAFQRGALCVVASGNSGANNGSGYPRDYQALLVTANDKKGERSGFGQRADTQWAVSAPGVEIHATWPLEDGGYATLQGTSMAAPHAAGAAALLFAQGLSNRDVVDRLMQTARPNGPRGDVGAGIIDVAAALGQERGELTGAPGGETQEYELPELYEAEVVDPGGPAEAPAAPSAEGGGEPSGEAPVEEGEPLAQEEEARTKGIQLAQEDAAAAEEDQPIDGTKMTLWLIAAAAVIATGGYTGSLWTRRNSKSRKLKEFQA